jgi:hypothetical protein
VFVQEYHVLERVVVSKRTINCPRESIGAGHEMLDHVSSIDFIPECEEHNFVYGRKIHEIRVAIHERSNMFDQLRVRKQVQVLSQVREKVHQ